MRYFSCRAGRPHETHTGVDRFFFRMFAVDNADFGFDHEFGADFDPGFAGPHAIKDEDRRHKHHAPIVPSTVKQVLELPCENKVGTPASAVIDVCLFVCCAVVSSIDSPGGSGRGVRRGLGVAHRGHASRAQDLDRGRHRGRAAGRLLVGLAGAPLRQRHTAVRSLPKGGSRV